MTAKRSGTDGAAEHALDLMHKEGDFTYGDVESLIQRHKILKKIRKARPSR